jgi:hypothetical protein
MKPGHRRLTERDVKAAEHRGWANGYRTSVTHIRHAMKNATTEQSAETLDAALGALEAFALARDEMASELERPPEPAARRPKMRGRRRTS